MPRLLALLFLGFSLAITQSSYAADLRIGTFDVDASPPIGSPLAYDPTIGIQMPLSCRGVVITGAGDPIVLCSVDWIGIASGGQTVFKESFAQAAGTTPERVAVHTIHQHDAPRCDFAADELLEDNGIGGAGFDPVFARDVVHRASDAIKHAIEHSKPVTHVGHGAGVVEKVASNRRILGPDGKVLHTRYTATKDPKIREFPAGTIDPELKMVSFWNEDEPVAVLTYYACHPQSYYRTGMANPDFPGMARNAREEATGVPHIHFNGAGGNIGAGKWNDGAKENRQVLADRVAAGMKAAWESTKKTPVDPEKVRWETVPVLLPVGQHLDAEALKATLENKEAKPDDRWYAAKKLVWVRRCETKDPIDLGCLSLNDIRILHMPGELFVEYQIAAQMQRRDLFVAMAAYGDYAPGYIGTEIAYSQGGYEASNGASQVDKTVEKVLAQGLAKLLKD